MAWGGGSFTQLMDNKAPGTYVNFVVAPNPKGVASKRGYIAVPMELPWGTDEDVLEVTVEDYRKNCKQIFGYPAGSDELKLVDEVFKHATTAYFYRLNNNGTKAQNDLAVARYGGQLGNKLNISVEIDPNAGTVENPLKSVTTEFNVIENTLNVRFNDLPNDYIPQIVLMENDSEVVLENVNYEQDENNVILTFEEMPKEDKEYKIVANAVEGKIATEISTGTLKLKYNEPTFREVEIKTSDETPNTSVGDELKATKVAFSVEGNSVTAKYTGLPEGYTVAPQIKLGNAVASFQNGRMEKSETADSITITIYPDGVPKIPLTFVARVRKTDGGTYTTIGQATVTPTVVGEDKDESLEISVTNKKNADNSEQVPSAYIVHTYLKGDEVDKQVVRSISKLSDNDYVTFKREQPLEEIAGSVLSGGSDGYVVGNSHQKARDAFESYYFNILVLGETDKEIQDAYVAYTKRLRDERGIKFQLVMPSVESVYTNESKINYEGVILVKTRCSDEDRKPTDLVYWFGGAEAGCPVNGSVMAMEYDGSLTPVIDLTQDQLVQTVENGEMTLHKQGFSILVFKDINSYCEVTEEDDGKRSKDFMNNQTVRVMDGIATDTATIFNNYYLGKFGNTEVNRIDLRSQFIKNREEYLQVQAISDYDESLLSLDMGKTIRDVVGWDAVKPVNCMERLFFTVEIINSNL